jgi:putative addiction module component (TIGR02574 family)
MMEEQHGSELRLTDKQAAEVRRRLAEPSPNRIPAEEVFKRLRTRIA